MSIGLTNALNNYKIPAGADLSMSSSREINPNNITCYNWNRVDSAGRQANGNTFATRTSGCTSAEAQIRPENALRPQYVEFLNGGGIGIQGNLDRGLNQVSTAMELPSNNPMSLPQLQLPGFGNASVPVQSGNTMPSSIQVSPKTESYTQLPVTFGFGMPTKVIPTQQYMRENYVPSTLPRGDFGVGIAAAVRPGPSNEHYTYLHPVKTVLNESYKSKHHTEHFGGGNSYTLADKLSATSNEHFLNAYNQAAASAGRFPVEGYTPQVTFATKLASASEPYAANNLSALDNARATSTSKQFIAGVY